MFANFLNQGCSERIPRKPRFSFRKLQQQPTKLSIYHSLHKTEAFKIYHFVGY